VNAWLWGLLLAILACWALGAYNRLVQLRQAVGTSFQAVAEQLQARHALIHQLAQAASQFTEPHLVEATQAAAQQAGIALDWASKHPGNPATMTSLALAEQVLDASLARLVEAAAQSPLDHSPLQATHAKLAFTKNLFNTSVSQYNLAVRQPPANLLCKWCGFQTAAVLPEAA
jgi:LemA protein